MKKLLALVLVLGLTSLASADLVFTVNGKPQPDTIYLLPSDTAEIDLELSAGENITKYELGYILSNAQAELLIGNISFPAPFDYPGGVTWNEPQYIGIAASQWGNPPTPLQGPLVLMQGLVVHCLDKTPVDLIIQVDGPTIIDGMTIPIGTVLHTLHIIQDVPEPMTIALLGLGSLFLRKRS